MPRSSTASAVAGALPITEVEVFGYQTGAPVPGPSTITGLFVDILVGGPPGGGGVPVPGSPGLAVNLLLGPGPIINAWTGIYRATDTAPLGVTRGIMGVRATLPVPLVLPPGVYWLVFQLTGALASGPFVPPISVLNQGVTGNALQGAAGVWAPIVSGAAPGFAQGLAFRLYGPAPFPPVGTIVNTGLASCGAATIAVGGAPVPGGFVRTELGGLTGLGFIGYGFSLVPTPFCVCVVGHDWSTALFTTANVLNIPMNPIFFGASLRVQGADFLSVGGCPAPAISFTDTWQINL